MRRKAEAEKRKEREEILQAHPWYNDLINKVVHTGGIKRKCGPSEQLLIDRIRG
jgi:hypothetical protein